MTTVRTSTGASSRTGRRKENQDAVRVTSLADGRFLAVLADGMGGYKGGAYASRRSIEVVAHALSEGASLTDAVRLANAAIVKESQDPERSGMGTTIVGVLVDGTTYQVFNVGDSRAYRIDADVVQQVSDDHSFVAEGIRRGELSEEEAATSRWKNALTRSIGTDGHVDVDKFGPFDITDSHVVLLCSDGIYKVTPDHVLGAVVRATANVTEAAQAIVDVAYRRGSDDNMSVVLVEFGDLERTPEITLPVPLYGGETQERTPAQGGMASIGITHHQRDAVAPAPSENGGTAWPTDRLTVPVGKTVPMTTGPLLTAPRQRSISRRPGSGIPWRLISVAIVALVAIAGLWYSLRGSTETEVTASDQNSVPVKATEVGRNDPSDQAAPADVVAPDTMTHAASDSAVQ